MSTTPPPRHLMKKEDLSILLKGIHPRIRRYLHPLRPEYFQLNILCGGLLPLCKAGKHKNESGFQKKCPFFHLRILHFPFRFLPFNIRTAFTLNCSLPLLCSSSGYAPCRMPHHFRFDYDLSLIPL